MRNLRSSFRSLGLFTALAAGLATSSSALAQDAQPEIYPISNPDRSHIPTLHFDAHTTQPQSGYASRAVVQDVYDSDAHGECIGYFGANHMVEDVYFGPVGPWANATDKALMEIQLLIGNNFGRIYDYDIVVKVWQNADFTANPMVSGTPLATLGPFQIRNAPDLAYLNVGANDFLPIAHLTGDHAYIEVSILAPGSNQLASENGGLVVTHQNTFPVGSTTDPWGRDRNANGILEGGTLDAPLPNEHVRSIFQGPPCTGNAVIADLVLRGVADATPPANATEITLLDSGLTMTANLAPNEIKWYKFEVPGNVTDARRTFLDIDTEGSQLGPVNEPVLALFDGVGVLLATNRDSGSDLQAQLSFGIGNRPANGNGLVFDGANGELTFPDGPYYLGVGSFPAGRVGNGWLLTSDSQNAGTVTVNFRTNSTFAAPLAPSAEPNVFLVNNGSSILAPGASFPATNPGVPGVLWYKFTTCGADGSSAQSYLDIDFSGSASPTTVDQIAYLFDSNGNLVRQSDDEGPSNLPQFSFGSTNARPAYNGSPTDPSFAGEQGPLPAGTYYLAAGFSPMRPLSNAQADGRWFVRPQSGDDLNIRVDFYTGLSDCGSPSTCGTSDFNGDGDFGTDADIQSFFACLAGNCCPTCWRLDADFNADGDAGTDADIESFFRVLSGNPC